MNFDQNLKKTNSNILVEKVTEKCAPPAQKFTIPFFLLKKTKNEKKSIEKACVVGVFRGQSLGGGCVHNNNSTLLEDLQKTSRSIRKLCRSLLVRILQ